MSMADGMADGMPRSSGVDAGYQGENRNGSRAATPAEKRRFLKPVITGCSRV